MPITAIPCVKRELRNHPVYKVNVNRLSEVGVEFLDSDPVTYGYHNGLAAFDWRVVAETVAQGCDEMTEWVA